MKIRYVEISDLPVIAEMMHKALNPYYGGDHRAHARRIVESASTGSDDKDGHLSQAQIMYVVEDDGRVIGVVGATPKKDNSIKLMPLVAENTQALSALLVDLPSVLREYGHKLYTHNFPTDEEVEVLQHYGWKIEAILPGAYKSNVTTQQWGLDLEEKEMKKMRVKRKYFDAGDGIRLECGEHSKIIRVEDVRV